MSISRRKIALALVLAGLTTGCSHAGIVPAASQSGANQTLLPANQALLRPGQTLSMTHVLTWDAMDNTPGSVKITALQAAPWLNYALTIPSTSVLVKAAGIKSAIYMNPNRLAPGDMMYTKDESEFAHTCSGSRIHEFHPNPRAFYTNPHSSHLASLWVQALATEIGWGAILDYVFEDNADSAVPQNMSGTPCNFTWADWTAATNQLDNALGTPIIGNNLGYTLPGSPSPGPGIGINPSTAGGMSEDCYSGRTPTGYYWETRWQATENTELQMAAAGKIFICHADWYVKAQNSMGQRLYFYASFLLTYDRTDQVVDTQFDTPSGLHVMPEAQLVPTSPKVSAPSDISGLLQPSGVYGREYNACYLAGQLVGACAIVVNMHNPQRGPPMAFPWPATYHHTLTMSGAGAYDGGRVSITGPAPPVNMPGGTAAIVFP
jgi:hypothetical protein